MFINRNSNVGKAMNIFKVNKTSTDSQKKKDLDYKNFKLDCTIDDVVESQYITRNFQIGITYVQIAKSTLSQVKETLFEMREVFEKCKNESNTSFGRESLNFKFEELCNKFNKESSKLNIDIRENLFYNSNNELVFKIFDSSSLDDCILIPKLDPNKLNLRNINIRNSINAEIADKKMSETLDYILSSEKAIKSSADKLLRVNLTDIISENLLALSSNANKESIQNLIDLTKKGIIKDNYTYHVKDMKKKNIDDLLR